MKDVGRTGVEDAARKDPGSRGGVFKTGEPNMLLC